MGLVERKDLASILSADPGFTRLVRAIALGEGFQLLIVISDSSRVFRKTLELLEREVPRVGGRPVKVHLIDPYGAGSDGTVGRLTEERLFDSVLSTLVFPPFHDDSAGRILAVDGSGASADDQSAWRALFRRMNERRNIIVQRIDASVLLCLTTSLHQTFAHEAPDFWSIRSGVIALSMPFFRAGLNEQPDVKEPSRGSRYHTPWTLTSSDALSEAVVEARKRLDEVPGDPSAARALAIHLTRWGDTCAMRGDLKGALAAQREALSIAQRLANAEPDRAGYQRDLTVSYERMGDLYSALGQNDLARDAFVRALEIAERLANAEPDRADYLRDLLVSHIKLAYIYRALGKGQSALDVSFKAVEFAERLTRADPQLTEHQRNLAVSYTLMGDLFFSLGHREIASDLYSKGLVIVESLAKGEPNRTDYQRDLAVSYEHIGDMYRSIGEPASARDAFFRTLAVRERLAKMEPDRADYQRDLVVSYIKMGDVERGLGQGEQARDAFLKALLIVQRLANAEPDRADYQRDLVVSLVKVAAVDDDAAAGDHLQQALDSVVSLRDTGRLNPVDEWMIPDLRGMLDERDLTNR